MKLLDHPERMNQTQPRKSRGIARLAAISSLTISLALPVGIGVAQAATPELKDVQRSGSDLTDLTMSWPAVANTDHYTVSIAAGAQQSLKTVSGDQLTATFNNVAPVCDRIAVQVTAVSPDGGQTTTSVKRLPRTAPGGVSNIRSSRGGKGGSDASLTWNAPVDPGMAPVSDYTVLVKQQNNGNVLLNRKSSDTSFNLSGLDGNRQYVAKVTANNPYGACVTSTALFLNQKPTPPRNVQAWRSPGDPSSVEVQWDASKWTGYGALDGYEVSYRPGNKKKYTVVEVGNVTSTKLDLAPERRWSIFVRAINGNSKSRLSREVWVRAADEPEPLEADPRVEATAVGRVVTIQFDEPVGKSRKFPKMIVAVAPSDGRKGPRGEHQIANGAATVVFDRVACGEYTLVVAGVGKTSNKELARLTFNRCEL